MAKDVYMLHNLQCTNRSRVTDGLRIYSEILDRSKRKWEQEIDSPLMAIDMLIMPQFSGESR